MVGFTVAGLATITTVAFTGASSAQSSSKAPQPRALSDSARRMIDEGRRVFRYETFGDQAYWGDTLKLHRAIAGAKLGGVGPGVSPKTALSVGLKVDVDAYDLFFKLGLSESEKRDLVEYLKSL